MAKTKTRILLVDDHHLVREGLSNIIKAQPDFEVVGEASDGIEAIVMASNLLPDLILMDLTMPVCDGLEATHKIKAQLPEVTIVMLTVNDKEKNVFEAIRNGAQGYLLKSISSKELLASLRGAVRGEAAITRTMAGRMLDEFRRISQAGAEMSDQDLVSLTIREQEVLVLVAEGKSNKEIAAEINVSVNTVKSHMRKILAKLHLEKRQEAALFAKQKGLIYSNGDSESPE